MTTTATARALDPAERLRLTALARTTILKLEKAFNLSPVDVPIHWNLKSRSCIAQARHFTTERTLVSEMRFSHEWATLLPTAVYEEAMVHEACHVIQYRLWDRSGRPDTRKGQWAPHGAVWKSLMRAVGYPNARTTLDITAYGIAITDVTSGRKTRATIRVTCSCPGRPVYEVTPARAERLTTAATTVCRRCRQRYERV